MTCSVCRMYKFVQLCRTNGHSRNCMYSRGMGMNITARCLSASRSAARRCPGAPCRPGASHSSIVVDVVYCVHVCLVVLLVFVYVSVCCVCRYCLVVYICCLAQHAVLVFD